MEQKSDSAKDADKTTAVQDSDGLNMLSLMGAPRKAPKIDKVERSIGTATMGNDNVITLDLRVAGPSDVNTSFRYKPGDKNYQDVLKHLGGISPGETKQVRPFPPQDQSLLPDGSMIITVQPGDKLRDIVSSLLRDAHVQDLGYQPSAKEIRDAEQKVAKDNKLADPRHLPVGQDLWISIDGTDRTSRHHFAPVDNSNLVQSTNASPQFVKDMKAEVDKLAPEVRTLLEQQGIHIVIAGQMSDYDPVLASSRPRGWPPGSTWNNADGMFDGHNALVTEKRTDVDGKLIVSGRSAGVLRHEVGHGLDTALGSFSHTDEYKQAWLKDAGNMTDKERDRLSYFLQGYPPAQPPEKDSMNAGLEESFADVFAAINGGSANMSDTTVELDKFPTVTALIKTRLGQLTQPGSTPSNPKATPAEAVPDGTKKDIPSGVSPGDRREP